MVRLYIEDDAGNVRIVPIETDSVRIGRAPDNTVVLPERNVSRYHALIRLQNGRIFVEDVRARYGLFLNGQRVDGRSEIRPGDLLGLGDFKLKILPADGAIAEEEAPVSEPRRTTASGIPTVAMRSEDAESRAATIPMEAQPERHDEAPGQRLAEEPVSGPAESAPETSLISLREMEKVARHGLPDRDEPAPEVHQRKTRGRVIALLALVVCAVALGAVYLWVSQPAEVAEHGAAPVTAVAAPPATAPAEPVAAPPQPVAATRPPEPAEAPPSVEAPPPARPAVGKPPAPPPVVKPAAPEPAKPRETRPVAVEAPPQAASNRAGAEPAPRERPKPAEPRVAAVTPRPAESATGNDPASALNRALASGDLAEAERIAQRCTGEECPVVRNKLAKFLKTKCDRDQTRVFCDKAKRFATDPRLRDEIDRILQKLQ